MMDGMTDRPTKISFGEMRDSGVRGLLIYYADCRDCDQPGFPAPEHASPFGPHAFDSRWSRPIP
jgi:hypothetical protein